jgi:hypothetical protein
VNLGDEDFYEHNGVVDNVGLERVGLLEGKHELEQLDKQVVELDRSCFANCIKRVDERSGRYFEN